MAAPSLPRDETINTRAREEKWGRLGDRVIDGGINRHKIVEEGDMSKIIRYALGSAGGNRH